MKIPFTKMHGIGNDFVVIDGTKQKYNFNKNNIKNISDRHFGIGCDQVLLIESAKENDVDFFISIFNADGTLAEQCGNGIRCITKFVFDNNLTSKKNLSLATFARKIQTKLENDGNITVNIGVPILEPNLIPFKATQKQLQYKLLNTEIGAISIGNPHAVILVDDITNAPIHTLGKMIAAHPDFPNGVNVNFMQIDNRNSVKLRVYERGAGETLACGSGACASVAIGRLWNLLDANVQVALPGGVLKVSWQNFTAPIFLTGPAVTIFTGELKIS